MKQSALSKGTGEHSTWRLRLAASVDVARAPAPDATLDTRVAQRTPDVPACRDIPSVPRLPGVGPSDESDLVISGLLGKGGMGVVHLAVQRGLDREVAVKRVRPGAERCQRTIAALLTEARVQGVLDHPNVVPIHGLFRDPNGLPVLVMKRLSGVSWRALIRDPQHPGWPQHGGDPLAWHLDVLMQICNAVHFAHSRGVIHRDIKPDNVMIGALGEVYLLDWGLAYCLCDGDAVDDSFVGSPSYLAPEMLHGTGPHITPQTDIYLLGATLHEVLVGATRHGGASVVQALVSARESKRFDYPPSVPVELAALCNRAMGLDPRQRPESALAFRQAIAGYLRHRGSRALAEAASARLEELRTLRASSPADEREELARLRRAQLELDPVVAFRPRILLVAGLGFLMGLITLGVWLSRDAVPSHREILAVLSCHNLFMLTMFIAFPRKLGLNRRNLAAVLATKLTGVACTVNHTCACLRGVPETTALLGDLILAGAITASLAVQTDGMRWEIPTIFFAATSAAVLWPSLTLLIVACAVLAAALTGGLTHWVGARRREAHRPSST